MRGRAAPAAWLALTILAACGGDREPAADLVLTGGRIYTVDDDAPWAEAVAIRDGRFVYVGDDEGAEAFAGESSGRVDLGGRFVMPGLIDGHTHPGMYELEQYDAYILEKDRDAFLAGVREAAEAHPGNGWLRLCCWPNFAFVDGREGPHRRDLDAIAPDRPVWITSLAWHSYWLNSKALGVLGIEDDTGDPRRAIAVYDRDDSGELTGWLKEGAGWQYFPQVFEIDADKHRRGMTDFLHTLSEHGVTTVYDGGNLDFEDEVYGLLAKLEREGQLPLRYEGTYMVYLPERRHLAVREMKRLRESYGGERLRFRTIKLFMDGINSNRSAGMLEPYSDDPTYVGNTMLTAEELKDFLLELHEEKFDLHIHAIGDLAVRTALDGVEAARAAVAGELYPRVTLAHMENIDPADWPRFGELGVSANFTGWWHGVDIDDPSEAGLGEDRYALRYTAKPVFDGGGNVTFSSDDWRLEVLSPFLTMQVAHNRQYPDNWIVQPGGGPGAFLPPETEKLDLELLVRGYTINGAYPFRMENDIGSIETGKLADLVVLDDDLFGTDRHEINRIKPAAVMMDGEFIHGDLER